MIRLANAFCKIAVICLCHQTELKGCISEILNFFV
jgi:hypothetical protein